MIEVRNAHKIFVIERERKRQLGTPRRSWKDDIRMDLRKIMWEGVDWEHVVRDRDHPDRLF
jgi:hypothetical protein